MGLNLSMRPIGPWLGEPTPYRIESPFRRKLRGEGQYGSERLPLTETLDLLQRELEMIGCRHAVVEADVREQDIRADGWPKASARIGGRPGVILRVIDSKQGPLTFPCDRFTTWVDNLRAIALALEALRKVDRYGVTRRGEQYAGWKAIPASTAPTMTSEAAAELFAQHSGFSPMEILTSPAVARQAWLAAAKQTHPDTGASRRAFEAATTARAVLTSHHGVTV